MEQLLNLRQLLRHEVEDLYSAEEQIIEALPKMTEMATSPQLRKALNEHLKVTREQLGRLEKVKQSINKNNAEEAEKSRSFFERIFGGGTKCKGMEGLITEGEKMMSADMDPQVRDAAIIASCQKIEHYEISGYGTARAYANQLGMVEVERLLQTTLNEEYKADDLLTVLALQKINLDAQNANGSERNNRKTGVSNGNSRKSGKTTGAQKTSKSGAGAKKGAVKKAAPKKAARKRGAAR